MSPAAEPASFPTRSEIEEWDTTQLSEAAGSWRTAATASEGAFDQHRQNFISPGGTTWEGDAKDAALDRVTKDVAVVGRQNSVLREAASLAENGAHDVKAAKDKAVAAIAAAENDGFKVGEDLSVTDTREYDIATAVERNKAAAEHAEDIRWTAEQLAQADKLVGTRLQEKAADLQGIRFEDEGEGQDSPSDHVQLVDNKVQDESAEGSNPGPAEQATGQVGPFAVPKSVEDAAKKAGLKPGEKPPAPPADDGGLGDLLGANDHREDKPSEGKPDKPGEDKPPGLPPALSQLPPAPDKATIDQQRARVEEARQSLAAAEAKQKAAAEQGYVQGAGSGPSQEEFRALTQDVFDARRELTEQTNALRDLSAASAANGGPAVPVPPLPVDADKQAFPPPPSVSDRLAEASHEISKNTFGLVPDVAKDVDTFMNWGQASGEEKTQAVLDSAGMVPLPGAKLFGEGIEHGLDALGGVARHFDDAPTPHADAPPTPSHVDAPPVEHHSDTPPAEHHVDGDAANAAPYSVEDTSELLAASEATGGHLIDRHVGLTVDDLSARLDATKLPVVSSFGTADEAASAVSTALQRNQQVVDEWISNGAVGKIELDAPFSGGQVLHRGFTEAVEGTAVRVVLKGDGTGGWYVLTGFPTP